MQEYILKTSDLSVGYDGKPLIHDINISVQRGKVLTLIGPNGSGKSTILKTLTKYLKTIAGTVYVGDREIDTLTSRDLAKQVSVVLTQRLRTEMMTCEDVVLRTATTAASATASARESCLHAPYASSPR